MDAEQEYKECIESEGYKMFIKQGYEQVFENIRTDDSISDEEERKNMRNKFFQHLKGYKDSDDVEEYFCDGFFYNPDYQFKGKKVSNFDYYAMYGHVTQRKAFVERLFRNSKDKNNNLYEAFDNAFESILIKSTDRKIAKDDNYLIIRFIEKYEIDMTKIKEHLLWIFKGLSETDVYEGYEIKNLPCLLALPCSKGLIEGYEKEKWVTFSLRIPKSIDVYKPTAYDANIVTAWRRGGRTVRHVDNPNKDKEIDGFEEFILNPSKLNLKTITIYKLYNE
jgi:hypothetical protein